jgi:putative SOS response-associated peptidase YedK
LEISDARLSGTGTANLYSITTNQAAIIALFRVVNRYVGNLAPMPGVFPDYPAPVIRNTDNGTELAMMRWGMPPPSRTGGPPVTNIRNTSSPHWRGWLEPENRCRSRRQASFLLNGNTSHFDNKQHRTLR